MRSDHAAWRLLVELARPSSRGALANLMVWSPCPGSLPCAAHVCHSKLRQMLYGRRSPYRLRMFTFALTQRSAWAPSPEKVGTLHGLFGSSGLTCWLQYSSIDSSKPRSAGACACHCSGAARGAYGCIGAVADRGSVRHIWVHCVNMDRAFWALVHWLLLGAPQRNLARRRPIPGRLGYPGTSWCRNAAPPASR